MVHCVPAPMPDNAWDAEVNSMDANFTKQRLLIFYIPNFLSTKQYELTRI